MNKSLFWIKIEKLFNRKETVAISNLTSQLNPTDDDRSMATQESLITCAESFCEMNSWPDEKLELKSDKNQETNSIEGISLPAISLIAAPSSRNSMITLKTSEIEVEAPKNDLSELIENMLRVLGTGDGQESSFPHLEWNDNSPVDIDIEAISPLRISNEDSCFFECSLYLPSSIIQRDLYQNEGVSEFKEKEVAPRNQADIQFFDRQSPQQGKTFLERETSFIENKAHKTRKNGKSSVLKLSEGRSIFIERK